MTKQLYLITNSFVWYVPQNCSHMEEESFLLKVICSDAQSCPTVCDPMNHSPQGSTVHGILQARILEWVAISCSRGSSDPGIEPSSPASPALAGRFFATKPPGNPLSLSAIYLHLNVIVFEFIIATNKMIKLERKSKFQPIYKGLGFKALRYCLLQADPGMSCWHRKNHCLCSTTLGLYLITPLYYFIPPL